MHSVLWLQSSDRLSAPHNAVSLSKTLLLLGGRQRISLVNTGRPESHEGSVDTKDASFPSKGVQSAGARVLRDAADSITSPCSALALGFPGGAHCSKGLRDGCFNSLKVH